MLRDIENAVNKYKTPMYIFNMDILMEHLDYLIKRLDNRATTCYAMKANPFLLDALSEDVSLFEVCSPGELKICRKRNVSPEKIVLSGVFKEDNDMLYAMSNYGVTTYTVESYNQYELLKKISSELKININLIIRITSGNQFGVDKDVAKKIINDAKASSFLSIEGIQRYSGTQKKKPEIFDKELRELVAVADEIEDQCDVKIDKIEYGPGLFYPYFQNDIDNREELLNSLITAIDENNADDKRKIVLEMGRFIAAECGYYVTKIVDMKENANQKYCIVDGGINHLNYYGQTMAMRLMFFEHYKNQSMDEKIFSISQISENKMQSLEYDIDNYTICGSLCTTADVIIKNMPLESPKCGDVLLFKNTGAYSVTEGIYLFLSRDMPVILSWSQKEGIKLLRESFETYKLN